MAIPFSLLKLSIVSTFVLGLAACGGGGGSSGGSGSRPAPSVSSLDSVRPDLRSAVRAAKSNGTYADGLDIYGHDFPRHNVRNGRVLINGTPVDTSTTPPTPTVGFHTYNEQIIFDNNNKITQTFRLYEQPYSQVLGITNQQYVQDGRPDMLDTSLDIVFHDVRGLPTASGDLPRGSVHYEGVAFDNRETGRLVYDIDFARRQGSGSISGLSQYGTVTLDTAPLGTINGMRTGNMVGVNPTEGRATFAATGNRGYYGFGLFGPQAAEMSGIVFDQRPDIHDDDSGVIGFGGARQ